MLKPTKMAFKLKTRDNQSAVNYYQQRTLSELKNKSDLTKWIKDRCRLYYLSPLNVVE